MTDTQSSNFTQLKANILFNNTLREEPISIRNVWKKGANYYFDVLFYASKQTRVLDISYFHDIYDTKTRRYYKDMQLFIKDLIVQKFSQISCGFSDKSSLAKKRVKHDSISH